MTHRQPVDLLLVVVEDEAEVDGHDGAVAEQEGGVADLADQGLDLAQDGESTQVGRQVGHLVVAGNQGRVKRLVTIFFTIYRAWGPHSIEVAYAHLTQRPGFGSRPRCFLYCIVLWTAEKSKPSSSYGRDNANGVSGEGLS